MSRGPVLTSPRLVLAPTHARDSADVLGLFGDPEITRYWGHGPLADREAADRWVRQRERAREGGRNLDWIVRTRACGTLVGYALLGEIDEENRRGEIGYADARAQWARGYAGEIIDRVLAHAFEALALHRVEADVDPRNEPSLRVLQRRGFVREGLLRDRWQITGEVQDSAILGLLAPEWRASRKTA